MAYMRAKISEFMDADAEQIRWRILHGPWSSAWYAARETDVFEPPVPAGVIAPAYLELDRAIGPVTLGPYDMPYLDRGDSVVFHVILH